jgi:hypothetical protein
LINTTSFVEFVLSENLSSMKKLFTLVFIAAGLISQAQVKSSYLYNTGMPYGTLDIRTKISSTDYYYLLENKTFAFRESSPGVRTNNYLDMTSTWDSSPFKQGNLRRKTGTADKFIMNYRLLFPNGYSTTYAEGYPLIILFHGGVERANCYFNTCYHGTWSYNPNTNSPAAPTTSTHKLLNNDHQLLQGGKTHLDARNLAGTKLPNDPTLAARAFPGFVLVPQMMNDWDSLSVQDAIRLVQLVAQKYNVDENRIYVEGLSVGGRAVWQAVKRAQWLFAAALPMSAINDAWIRKHNQIGKAAYVPFWIFQGGSDTYPSPTYTSTLVNDLKKVGGMPKYTNYAGVGHTCWNKAFAEPAFFSWMRAQTKSNIQIAKGITVIDKTKSQYPKLMLSEGFFVYQWERNGVIISGATTNTYTATVAGTYRARFSRVSAPTSTQWNKWSAPVTITAVGTTATAARSDEAEEVTMDEEENQFRASVFPNPTSFENFNIEVESMDENPVTVEVIDGLGRSVYQSQFEMTDLAESVKLNLSNDLPKGIYYVIMRQGRRSLKQKVMITE